MSPTLGDLFAEAGADAGLTLTGLTADSRKVEPGFVFLAVPGTAADGRLFAAKAAAAGAVAMVAEGERPADLPESVTYLSVPDARRALSQAAARLHPGQPDTVVAVTGTSGKSSVADFVRQIFGRLGREAASLGTLGVITTSGAAYGSLTTPDPITLHRTLDRLKQDGITELAMEASSHGIEQSRLDGVRLTAAGFTDVSCGLQRWPIRPPEPREFTRSVCIGAHSEQLPEELREQFLDDVMEVLGPEPELDYVRLNISARKGAAPA